MRLSEPAPSRRKSLKSLFNSMDVNCDDKVTLIEWINAFDMIDSNHNGVISRKEWCLHQGDTCVFDAIATKRFIAVISREEWRRAFNILDTDKDGSISIEEWASPGGEGKTMLFNMDDCEDVAALQSLCVLQAEPDPTRRSADRIISINEHYVYGKSPEDIELCLQHARNTGRCVRLEVEEQPVEGITMPKVGDRLQALAVCTDIETITTHREGDFGQVYLLEKEHLYIAWERTGKSTQILGQDWKQYYAVVGQVKTVPEVADLVQELPGNRSEATEAQIGVVSSVDGEEVHILWDHDGSKRTVPKSLFLKYYMCVGRLRMG